MSLRIKYKKDIIHGKIIEQMLLLLFPVFLGYLLQQLYGLVDAIILGKFVGKAALASVGGSATAIINVIINIIAGITSAIMVSVAQNYGKGDYNKIQDTIKTGYFISICLGGVLTVIVLVFSPLVLRLMGLPAENMDASLTYLRYYALGFIPYFIYQTGICILRAIGDNRRPTYFILIVAITKIVFDLLFAGIFKLGVTGTSLATFLSYLVCGIATLLVFNLTPDIYHYNLKDFGFAKEELKFMFKMGTPFAIQNAAYAIPSVIIQSKINVFGTDAIAAYSAYSNVDALYWCFSNALSNVTLTMVGQNFGNKNIPRVKRIVITSVLMEIAGAIIIGGSFIIFGRNLLSMFLNENEVIEIGMSMLKVTSLTYVLHMFGGTIGAACKGCGLARFPATATLFTILATRIIFLVLYPHQNPADPMYCFPISWILTSATLALYFFTNKILKEDNNQ